MMRGRTSANWALRRAAFYDVADINLRTVQFYRREHLVQQLSRRADKRDALQVFVPPRPFPNEHDFGGWISISNYNMRPRLRKPTSGAALQFFI